MLRRDFLTAGALLGLAGCERLMATGLPVHNPPVDGTTLTMSAHADYRIYEAGNFRVTISSPRIAYEAAPGGYAWFAGMNLFPTGEILLRVNTQPDSNDLDGAGKHLVSTDGGATFPTGTSYAVAGSHTSNEPLVMESDGTLHGGDYFRWTLDVTKRIGDCARTTITNRGITYASAAHGCTFTFPSDVNGTYGTGPSGPRPGISWFGNILRIASNRWLTVIPINYSLPLTTRIYAECFESTDQGVTWTWVGRTVGEYGDSGAAEPSTWLLNDGRIMCVSATGVGPGMMVFSSNLGRTWTSPVTFNAWPKAMIVRQLTNSTQDMLLTSGYYDSSRLAPAGTLPALLGLYLSTSPDSITWSVIDLVTHHNATSSAEYAFDSVNPSTGYMSHVELSTSGGVSNVLISYDQAGAAYGSSSRLNRVFVVNASITRIS